MKQELLKVRQEMKERKPDFIRQDYHRRKRIKHQWRKPKGIHSKIRHQFKGRRKMPSPGYKSPAMVSGLHSTGLKIVRVFSVNDIIKMSKDTEGAVISSSVGKRKMLEMLRKAREMGINVLNINADEKMAKIEEFVISKKKKTAQKKDTKKEKEKEKEEEKEKAAQKPAAKWQQEEKTQDEKKEAEKREKDRVLTKRA